MEMYANRMYRNDAHIIRLLDIMYNNWSIPTKNVTEDPQQTEKSLSCNRAIGHFFRDLVTL